MAEYSLSDLARSGIYRIVNTVNGKHYVGSALCFRKRWNSHRWGFANKKHPNRFLMAAWLKHGAESFVFEVLEFCSAEQLIIREQWWIDETKPAYNLAPRAGNCLGVKHSEETRRRVSERNKGNKYSVGRVVSAETRAKIGQANRGRVGIKHSPEVVAMRAAAHRGMKRSDETRRRISDAMVGKKMPPRTFEHRQKISLALKGRSISPESYAALQAGRAAHKYTDEEKAARSASLRAAYESGRRSRDKSEQHKNKIGQAFAKLSDEQVREIRSLRCCGVSCKDIAERFSSNPGTISEIATGKRYRWVK